MWKTYDIVHNQNIKQYNKISFQTTIPYKMMQYENIPSLI